MYTLGSNSFRHVLLCDARFSEGQVIPLLSKWLRPQIRIYDRYGEAISNLVQFFKRNAGLMLLYYDPL